MNELFHDAEFWVLIAFIIFVLLIVRKGKSLVEKTLDDRSNAIKDKINNSKNALHEAQKLLKNSQDLLREHKKSAKDIIKEQKAIADNNAKNYLLNINKEIDRKILSAEKEIEYMHINTINNIQEKISKVTIKTLEDLFSNELKSSNNNNLFDNFLKEVPQALSNYKK